MPAGKRVDVEECEDFVGFEELEGGDVAWCLKLSALFVVSHVYTQSNCGILLPLTILQKIHAAFEAILMCYVGFVSFVRRKGGACMWWCEVNRGALEAGAGESSASTVFWGRSS